MTFPSPRLCGRPRSAPFPIRTMRKAPAPKPDPEPPGSFPPDGATAKAGPHRSTAQPPDAGRGMFLAILAAKAEGAGRHVRTVDPRNTSRQGPDRGPPRGGGAADTQPTDRTVIPHASSKASSKRSYAGFGRRAASHGRESAVRGG